MVAHPASIKVAARDRVKTDKRDSLKMAKQLSNGELKGINVPDERRERFRILTRTRNQLVDSQKRIGNQLKSLLFTQGLIEPNDDMKVCKTWIKKVQQLQLAEEIKYSVDLLIQLWLDLDVKLAELMKKLRDQAQKDEVDIIYRSVPGVGELSARILANELGDMKHFRNEKSLFSYTGLTPSEYSSGEQKHLGNISRQGKALLRMILVQIAWRSIEKDQRLREIFERISKKAGKKRAIVAIARKIIGCMRACFMTGTKWCANVPDKKEYVEMKAAAC